MIANQLSGVRKSTQRVLLLVQTAVLATAGMLPFVLMSSASAAPQLPNREARITTARPGQTFDIVFEFDTTTLGSATSVQGAELEFCDAPLGTCNTSNTPTIPGSSTVSETGWDQTLENNTFGTYTLQNGDSGGTNNQIKVSRTDTDDQRTRTNVTIGFTGLTHNATANRSFYPRIRLYSDTGTSTLVWEGAVAQSTSQTLTINARVQEILQFCVGATAIDDATTSPGAACANISGTSVDIGVIDSGAVSVTPVAAVNGGDGNNGIAMVRTNAQNGVSIQYKALLDSSSGALKVPGASCVPSSTDQCFASSGTTQNAISAGTEEFGMTIGGINCGSTVSYACAYASGTSKLKPTTDYQGAGTFGSSWSYGVSNGYAWDDTGSADIIASSTTVVDDEAMILKFAAAAGITTPTGQYSTQADFIATPTF